MKTTQEYLESPEVLRLSAKAQLNYRDALRAFDKFLKRFDGILEKIDKEFIELYAAYLRKTRSASTIRQYITVLKMYLFWAESPVDYVYKIPSEDKRKQQLKNLERWFTEADIKTILDHEFKTSEKINGVRNRLIIRLLAETGARVREIANVDVEDFDEENNIVILKVSKTEPRPAFYSNATARLYSKFKELTIAEGCEFTGRIFPLTQRVKYIVTNALEVVGLKKIGDGRGPHTFRHYVATYLYFEGGMSLEDVAICLGDRPDTIRENYLHPTPLMLRKKYKEAMRW